VLLGLLLELRQLRRLRPLLLLPKLVLALLLLLPQRRRSLQSCWHMLGSKQARRGAASRWVVEGRAITSFASDKRIREQQGWDARL
jgi:hypothetical protein